MWHEVLLALSGHNGDIFTQKAPGDPLEVLPAIPFLHKSERQMLDKICSIGHLYAELDEFVTWPPLNKPEGQYIRALRIGVDAQLATYRNTLLAIETKVNKQPDLPISNLYNALEEWYLLFPPLTKTLSEITHDEYMGAKIMDLMQRNGSCGIRCIETVFNAIELPCRKVHVHHISAWLLHGLLLDKHNEFWIQTSIPTNSIEMQAQIKNIDLWGSYSINVARLPACIPLRVANKILFIGKATQVLGKANQFSAGTHSFLQQEQLRYYQVEFAKLYKTSEGWNDINFEKLIESIRSHCAQHLWDVLARVGRLGPTLQAFKDFFLVDKGELFLEFYHQANGFCSLPMTTTSGAEAQTAYARAANSMKCDDTDEFNRFEMIVRPKRYGSPDSDTDTGDVWAELGFQPRLIWPLQLVFTDDVIAKYNTLFLFLFRVSRTQYSLHRAWAEQMHQAKTERTRTRAGHEASSVTKRMQSLRSVMAFLIDNLMFYLKGDVVESQFSVLMAAINGAREFDAICTAHNTFLTTVLLQTFRTTPPVRKLLGEILLLCESLCALVHRGIWRDTAGFAELDRVEKGFNRQMSFLFKMLKSVGNNQGGKDHLSQLLLRINFNDYLAHVCDTI
eukprot:m.77392 g.77392  ORF g.77392 m.77392 type:complete len:619 (-) comp25009_c3_seq1:89-1945(-)